MKKRTFVYPFLLLLTFLFGCGPIASTELKASADTSLFFKEVQENPEAYKGKIVVWGGQIVQILPQENGTTLIEVLEWPLGFWDEPRKTVTFQGKFLVSVKEPLDPSIYKRGKRVTIAGEIQGEMQGSEIKGLTDPTYRYPIVLNEEMHVWRYPYYSYSSVPDYRSTWEYHPTLR